MRAPDMVTCSCAGEGEREESGQTFIAMVGRLLGKVGEGVAGGLWTCRFCS